MNITIDKFQASVKKAAEKGRGLDWINEVINCPKRYLGAVPEQINKQVKECLTNNTDNLNFFLYGGVGTGKTYTGYALAKLLYVNGNSVTVYGFISLLNKIKEYFGGDYQEEHISKLLFDSDIFILDDLGSEKVTDWSFEILYRLINTRYEKMLTTIIISNLNPEELSKAYGDRIMSRITEMMGDNIIKFTGNDRRMG